MPVFAQAIVLRRKKAGMSRYKLAQAVGKSYKYVLSIERGETVPSGEFLTRISKILNWPRADIFWTANQDAQRIPPSIASALRHSPKSVLSMTTLADRLTRKSQRTAISKTPTQQGDAV